MGYKKRLRRGKLITYNNNKGGKPRRKETLLFKFDSVTLTTRFRQKSSILPRIDH